MTFWKKPLLTIAAIFGLTATAFLTSCEKDSCVELQCKNGGSCAEGFCRCPSGYEGAECENRLADRFVGMYVGTTTCGTSPRLADTVRVWLGDGPDKLKLVRSGRSTDELSGTVNANKINISGTSGPGFVRTYNAVLDEKELSFYEQTDQAGNAEVCYFNGYKP